MIKDYFILSADTSTELYEKVKEWITEYGWQPHGNPLCIKKRAMFDYEWCQAMIKEEKNDK